MLNVYRIGFLRQNSKEPTGTEPRSMPTVTLYILYNLGPLPPHSFKILINVINTLLALSQEKWEEVEAEEKRPLP